MATKDLEYSNEADIALAFRTSQMTFKSGYTRPTAFRRRQLEQLWQLVDDNVDRLCEALYHDLRKPRFEAEAMELLVLKQEINDALLHLDEWVKDERTKPSLINRFGSICLKRKEPKGTVLIIGAWNYPLSLAFAPLIGAIAAGCTVVIKPSELAPSTAKAISELLPQYLDNNAFHVINGSAQETTRLLAQKWDHIFYTGNGGVAKIIMKAAAKHLTSLTLELGGKSPVVIDENTNMTVAAKRVVFGKMMNAGQTCVAPDYVLITAKAEAKFIAALKEGLLTMFGENPQTSEDFGRIVNDRHFKRLHKMLTGGKSRDIVIGGQTDEKDLYIAPTVIANVERDDILMQDEIFGPLLPLVRVVDVDDAIEFINSMDEPLALYIFSSNKKLIKKVLDSTRSGGVVVNDTMMHVSERTLPFGGIGPSGMGNYHGEHSFLAFTHIRSTMIKDMNPLSEAAMSLRYAPYNSTKIMFAKLALERVPDFKRGFIARHLKWIVLVFVFGIAYRRRRRRIA
ncbi:Aldehyde dehydrogenase [Mortierella alpina]|nr:Aldehyde dehydrogenase [Mortierella alpina]